MANSNSILQSILSSDLMKTLGAIVLTVGGMSYSIASESSKIKESIKEVNFKIELQNQQIKYELQDLRKSTERDYRYVTENFVKKTELRNYSK